MKLRKSAARPESFPPSFFPSLFSLLRCSSPTRVRCVSNMGYSGKFVIHALEVGRSPFSFHDCKWLAYFLRGTFFLSVNTILYPHLSLISAYKWPSPQYDALEEKLYQGGTTFMSFLTEEECRKRRFPKTPVAAEWIQLVRQFSPLILIFSVDE